MTLNRLRQKVKKKKLWAIHELGTRYYYGRGGVEKSLDKAIDYYKKGSELGDPRCMTNFGYFYQIGTGVDKNTKLAFHVHQQAAVKSSTPKKIGLTTPAIPTWSPTAVLSERAVT